LDKQTGIDGYLFGSTYLTAYRHLKSAGLPPPHSLRRFRVTRLQKMGTPRGLVQGWIGHAKEDVTDRYDKIMEDEAARKEWAKRVGLGFLLEEVS
jgi:integrase